MTAQPHQAGNAADESALVRCSIEVAASPDRAFEIFTAGIDTWWTRAHHVLSGELKVIGVDPFVGGRMWQENEAGDQCVWGRVLAWEPPREFAFSWLIGPDWGRPAPDARGSRVTVTFTPVGTGTQVDLVHDDLDAHGPGWEFVRDGVASAEGWPLGMRSFAASVERSDDPVSS
jgi:uncharacterized protein YndB with AHSA1/START domain